MIRKQILLFVFLAVSILSVDPPTWPQTFSQEFVVGDSRVHYYSIGKYWYDSKNQMDRTDIKDGRLNQICNSVTQGSAGPCTRINKNNSLYVWIQQKNQCCRFCNSTTSSGCQLPPRDWIKNFKYVGQATLSGQAFYKWSYQTSSGLQNYYASEDDKRIPRKIEVATAHYDMIMNTYSTQPISASVFTLPTNCNVDCPKRGF